MNVVHSLREAAHTARSRLAVTAALLSLAALLAACSQATPGGAASSAPASSSPPSAAATTAAAARVDLTITLTEAPGATPRVFRLVADGATPSAASNLPDSAAALAAVEQHGEKMFFALPDPTRVCTQQYGGPEIAVVTGWFDDQEVNASFSRTDGCEISRWQALAPLFGALAGSTGAV